MDIDYKKLKIIKTLQDSPRFLVQKVELNGEIVVLKKAKTKKMVVNLQNEILSYSIYQEIVSGHPDCPFQTASLLASGEDWIILSFLEGESGNDLVNEDEKGKVYDKIAEIMAFCDNKVSVNYQGKPIPLPQHYLIEMKEKLKKRKEAFKQIPEETGLNFGLLNTAIDYASKNVHRLKTCFNNPDLSHDHLIVSGDTASIFDFEINSLYHPRFLDLITQFSNLWFFGDKEGAFNFYYCFWRHKGLSQNEYLPDLKTLLYIKCISFTWQLITEPSDDHNTQQKLDQNFANNINEVLKYTSSL
ncbi:hypothetical protein KBD20_01725 [Candidatus Saccharibacteria bacterium]|nr:hypothetical protein [Candidatus Saccharibacteria bacterium]